MSRTASGYHARFMSRTASDYHTRFTSTLPHASSKASPSSSASSTRIGSSQATPPPSAYRTSNFPPGPPNETPQQKVARLRAASQRAKVLASTSLLDRVIDRGRVVADALHHLVALGLIVFSGFACLISLYAMGNWMIHNRRQKRAWVDRELQRLFDAQQAFLRGDATPEQLHLLQQERVGDEMIEQEKREKERKRRESWWGRGMAAVGLGPKGALDDVDEARYGKVRSRAGEVPAGDANDGRSVTEALRDMAEEKSRAGEEGFQSVVGIRAQGGPLDVLAENVMAAAKDTATERIRWLHWGKGGKSQSS